MQQAYKGYSFASAPSSFLSGYHFWTFYSHTNSASLLVYHVFTHTLILHLFWYTTSLPGTHTLILHLFWYTTSLLTHSFCIFTCIPRFYLYTNSASLPVTEYTGTLSQSDSLRSRMGERGLGLVVHIPSGYVAKINIP